MEKYTNIIEENRSVLSIPLEVSLMEVEKLLNKQLDGVIYEDNNIKDDNLMMRAVKREDIRVRVDSQQIYYTTPVQLWIQYDAGVTLLEATGEISMDFKTGFSITPDWELKTETSVEDYRWIQQPRLRMGLVNIPVGFLSDIILKNTRNYIAKTIDNTVKEQVKLEEIIADTWSKMYEPLLVSPEYNTWLQVNPEKIGMTPIEEYKDSLYTQIIIEGKPSVTLGAKPAALKAADLPRYSEETETFEGFIINIGADVTYDEAERLAKEQLVGEEFSYKKYAVTVQDVELFGQEDKVIVNTTLSGSYNGSIYMEGRPVYNERKNTIELRDLEYTLDTRSFLFKSASWLLKGTIKNRIEDNMNFLLDYNIKEAKSMITNQLKGYTLAPGVQMSGAVNELMITDVFVVKKGLHANVLVTGDLAIKVKNLENTGN